MRLCSAGQCACSSRSESRSPWRCCSLPSCVQSYLLPPRWESDFPSRQHITDAAFSPFKSLVGKHASDAAVLGHVRQQRLQPEPVPGGGGGLRGPVLPRQQPPVRVSGSAHPALGAQRGLLSGRRYPRPSEARPCWSLQEITTWGQGPQILLNCIWAAKNFSRQRMPIDY